MKPAGRIDFAAGTPAPPLPPWRVVVDSCQPLPGPIRLSACTTVTDPLRCIGADLASLELIVLHRNGGRDHYTHPDRIDELVERLAACGCRARVEPVT